MFAKHAGLDIGPYSEFFRKVHVHIRINQNGKYSSYANQQLVSLCWSAEQTRRATAAADNPEEKWGFSSSYCSRGAVESQWRLQVQPPCSLL